MSFWRKMQIKIHNRWNDNKIKSKVLLVLFWVSIISLFIAFRINIYLKNSTAYFGLDTNNWIYFLFIPIPLISAVLGSKYEKLGYHCKKNIVAGIIVIWLLVQFGTMKSPAKYEINNSLIKEYEKIINIDFPDSANVKNSKDDKPANANLYSVESTSYIIFKNKKEIKEFDKYIENDNKWIKKSDVTVSGLTMTPHTGHNDGYDNVYYMYYVVDNDFNNIPTAKGKYKAYSFIYNMDTKGLEVNEYNLLVG